MNISRAEKTALFGQSAGGLPIAWLLNRRASAYCKAVVMQVLFFY